MAVPVADRHLSFAEDACRTLTAAGIRADIDDREESVNRKVREAGMDWVPFVAVIGDREMETGTMAVTIRKESQPKQPHKEDLSPADLIARVKEETAGKPFRPLYTPQKLSNNPRFI